MENLTETMTLVSSIDPVLEFTMASTINTVTDTITMDNSTLILDNVTTAAPESGVVYLPHDYIILTLAPLLFLFGVPCNILSAVIMMRPHYGKTSTGVYLFFLAVVDSLFLTMNSITKNFIRILTEVDLNTTSTGACKIYVFLLFTSKCLSAWFVLAVTFERLIVVYLPMKAKTILTRSRAWLVSVLLIIIASASYAYVPYSYGLRMSRYGVRYSCTMIHNRIQMQMIHKIVDFLLYSALPFVICLILNIFLILRVMQSRQIRNTQSPNRISKKDDEIRRMTATLIIVSLLFLLCTSPMGIYLSVASYLLWVQNIPHFRVIYYSLYGLQLSNSTINFSVYCLSAPSFRRELRKMFGLYHNTPYGITNMLKFNAEGYRAAMFGKKRMNKGTNGTTDSTKGTTNGTNRMDNGTNGSANGINGSANGINGSANGTNVKAKGTKGITHSATANGGHPTHNGTASGITVSHEDSSVTTSTDALSTSSHQRY